MSTHLRRTSTLLLVALFSSFALVAALAPQADAIGPNAVRPGIGTSSTLARNDDLSTGSVPIGFTVNFFGNSYTNLFVNNNGNVTFNSALGTFTPFGLTAATGIPIIASYFADVDTRNTASAVVTYGNATVNGRNAFVVNYDGVGVGYYNQHVDKLNNFQQLLIDRSDTGAGNFDIEFNYDRVQWETGDASGGSNGFGGSSARVGYSNGTGTVGTFFEMPGSGVNGAFLDCVGTDQSPPCVPNAAGLIYHSLNSTQLGRYVFFVRNGIVVPPDTTPPSCALTAVLAGPPKQLQITVQDTGSGLLSIVPVATNAVVTFPPFTPGTTAPVVVTATKTIQTQAATVQLTVTDVAGNQTVCDPVLTVVDSGGSASQTYRSLPSAESIVEVINGDPGVKKLEIRVNGTKFRVVDLADGQATTIDVASAMRPGTNNTVELRATGKKGSTVTVVIHD